MSLVPLLVFVAAAGLLFFAVVEIAFTRLMRLPQRLEAEREGDNDVLGPYLDDPLQFFVPANGQRSGNPSDGPHCALGTNEP